MANASEVIPTEPIRPGRRLLDGIKQTLVGSTNIARGALGLGGSTLWTLVTLLVRAVRGPSEQEVEALRADVTVVDADGAGASPCARRRPLLIAVAVVAVLGLGGLAFKLLRTPPAPPVAPEPPRVRQFPTQEEIAAENAENGDEAEGDAPEPRIGE